MDFDIEVGIKMSTRLSRGWCHKPHPDRPTGGHRGAFWKKVAHFRNFRDFVYFPRLIKMLMLRCIFCKTYISIFLANSFGHYFDSINQPVPPFHLIFINAFYLATWQLLNRNSRTTWWLSEWVDYIYSDITKLWACGNYSYDDYNKDYQLPGNQQHQPSD